MITVVLWVIILLSILYILRFVWNAFSIDTAEKTDAGNNESRPSSSAVSAQLTSTKKTLPTADMAEAKALYRQRLAQLTQQREGGEITAESFASLKVELDRQLLLDSESAEHTETAGQSAVEHTAGFWPIFLLVMLVLSASTLYFYQQWRQQSQQWLQIKSATKDWVAASIANDHYPVKSVMADQASYQDYLRGLHALVLAEGQSNTDTLKLLANSYAEVGIFDMAKPLYERLLTLPGGETDANSLAYVNAAMMASGGRMSADAARRLEQLFRREGGPTLEVLYLLGLGAFNNDNYEIAITSWEPVLASYPKDSPAYQELSSLLQQARAALDRANVSTAETPAVVLPIAVSVDESLRAEIESTIAGSAQPLQLVIYARTPQMPMPVAVTRRPITADTQWPLSLSLSDQDALMPERQLSQQTVVVIGARLARTEDMRAQPGDFQSDEITINIAASRLAKPTALTLSSVIE